MKYLRYGCLSISKHVLFTFIMVLEIIALLVTTNVTIGTANSRQALVKPFDEIINKDGYHCFSDHMWETTEEFYEFYGLFNKLKSASVISSESYGDIKIIDDKIFFKYNIPLQSGSWPKTATDKNGTPYVVVSPDYMKNPGDTIYVDNVGDCIVSGVLTEVTYIPDTSSNYPEDENAVKDITNMYRSADYTATLEAIKNGSQDAMKFSDSAIIIPSSVYYKFSDSPKAFSSCFIIYDENISETDKKYNEGIIEQIVNFQEDNADLYPVVPQFTPLSKIKADTDAYIANSYNDILPIILVVGAIVLIGLIGSVAINTVTQIKNYGIYFLCGSKWSDCLKIAFANISIILVFSGVVSALLLYFSTAFNLNYLIGQVYDWNNLFISVGIILAMMILSLIIPFGIIKFTSPVEVIKSKK